MSRRRRLSSKGIPSVPFQKAPEQSESTTETNAHPVMQSAEIAEVPNREQPERRLELRMLKVLVVLLALHAAYAFSVGFDHNVSDRFGFRQSQTALGARSLVEGSPWFAYQVPLFGPPYGLPFEFPLYQWVTALFVAIGHLPLIAAGRIVHILFFVFCPVAL